MPWHAEVTELVYQTTTSLVVTFQQLLFSLKNKFRKNCSITILAIFKKNKLTKNTRTFGISIYHMHIFSLDILLCLSLHAVL